MHRTTDRHGRAWLAGLAGGLATLLLFAGVIAAYLNLHLLDEDGFAERVEVARHNEAVRQVLAKQLVQQLETHVAPDLLAVRPLLEEVITATLDTNAARPVFRVAATELHRQILDPSGSPLLLNLRDAGVVIAGALKTMPSIASRIPIDLGPALVRVSDAPPRLHLVSLARWIRLIGFICPFLSLALYGVAVYFADDRRRALVRWALAVTFVGLAMLLALAVGRALLLAQTQNDVAGRALAAVWVTFFLRLRLWSLVLVGAGILVASIGSGWLQAFDVEEVIEHLVARVRRRPASLAGAIVRASALMLLGFFAIAQPSLFVQILAFGTGCVLVLWGLSELLARVNPLASVEQIQSVGGAARTWRGSLPWVLTCAIVVLVGGLGVRFLISPHPHAPTHLATEEGACNGRRELCDRPLNEVVFASTHNSMSAAGEKGWYFASQEKGVRAQLDRGVRGFLVDLWYGAESDKGAIRTDLSPRFHDVAELEQKFGAETVAAAQRLAGRLGFEPLKRSGMYLCHGLCELGATPVVPQLRLIREWIEKNPREVLILFVEDGVTPPDVAKAFDESGLRAHVYEGPLGAEMPTLRALIDAGKQVIVLSESGAPGVDWYRDGFLLVQDNPWENKSVDDFRCTLSRGRPDSPLFLLNHWLSRQPPRVSDGKDANAQSVLLEHARRCERERGRRPNLVAVNFFEEGDLFGVVDELNGLPPREPPRGRR